MNQISSTKLRHGGRNGSSPNADNDASAAAVRSMLTAAGTTMINFMSSPGSGKTALLTALIPALKDEMRIRVMDVDIESALDAQRVADAAGVEALQIHNGGLCHIDADMVARALAQYPQAVTDTDLLILENIGNLVCPAEFDTGAHKNVMILSVPEGDDKPLKYPLMFSVCDLVLIRRLNPGAEILCVSAKTGEGLDAVCDWVRKACSEQMKVRI